MVQDLVRGHPVPAHTLPYPRPPAANPRLPPASAPEPEYAGAEAQDLTH